MFVRGGLVSIQIQIIYITLYYKLKVNTTLIFSWKSCIKNVTQVKANIIRELYLIINNNYLYRTAANDWSADYFLH